MLKTRKGLAALVALVVLALGGATISDAAAARHSSKHSASAKGKKKKHRSHVRRHATAAQDATGTETPGESSSEGAGESASDGPGGHADDPNDPNADHQFNGVE
jgi:hypothetical protein